MGQRSQFGGIRTLLRLSHDPSAQKALDDDRDAPESRLQRCAALEAVFTPKAGMLTPAERAFTRRILADLRTIAQQLAPYKPGAHTC